MTSRFALQPRGTGRCSCPARSHRGVGPGFAEAREIRAFFVHPDWVRRGIGTLILEACEVAAKGAGFLRLETGSTLTGAGFYRKRGYAALESLSVPLANGESLPIVRMVKAI